MCLLNRTPVGKSYSCFFVDQIERYDHARVDNRWKHFDCRVNIGRVVCVGLIYLILHIVIDHHDNEGDEYCQRDHWIRDQIFLSSPQLSKF